MDDIISTFTINADNAEQEPVWVEEGSDEGIEDGPKNAAHQKDKETPEISHTVFGLLSKFAPDGNYNWKLLGSDNGIVKDDVDSPLTGVPVLSFSSKEQIVTGPDGEKYYTDGTGLFVNVKDMDTNSAFLIEPEESFENTRHVVVPKYHSMEGKVVVSVNENDKLDLEYYLPQGHTAGGWFYKNILDLYSLTGQDTFDILDVCVFVDVDKNVIPTCEYFTASESVFISISGSESRHYAFDSLSKKSNSCSCPSVKKKQNLSNPSCRFTNQSTCSHYIAEEWEKIPLSFVGSIDDYRVDQLEAQTMRIGLGHNIYRLIDLDTNAVIVESLYGDETKEKTYEIFLDSLLSLGLSEIVEYTPVIGIPEDKVYTQYVANA